MSEWTNLRLLESMFKVVAFSKSYPECQTDENGIKPESNLNNAADKRVTEPSTCFGCLNDSYKNLSTISSFLAKIVFFLHTGKIIQVFDFDNWHPLLPPSLRVLHKDTIVRRLILCLYQTA